MDQTTAVNLKNIWSIDRELQNQAFYYLIDLTEKPVDWVDEIWDDLVAGLRCPDNHVRAIAAQVLCNLAKSDPEKRMLKDFSALLAVTRDKRFVTARHCLQALWRIGLVDLEHQELVVAGLSSRFVDCLTEKNCTLIRYDILRGFRNLYDTVKDENIRAKALALIETETDLKYRKKYSSLWRS